MKPPTGIEVREGGRRRGRTIDIAIRVCSCGVMEQLQDIALRWELMMARSASIFGGRVGFRSEQRKRLRAAEKLAERDPHLDVQIVTQADGACHVVVRRLGDWGCGCSIHRPRLVSGGPDA